ncbi:hypothetical protein [Arsenophonus nasoniae]|uniref:Uncharacterized protein n=1 Tax=Arsenophonus nasoniae TaxID=638 RepID=A0AA95GS14_9GAMM|nr:hypothetical protein [Arsenophonus nasoniae]WGM03807.1 hypothetical protein QE210_20190 [Arsenophonus nasoniae]
MKIDRPNIDIQPFAGSSKTEERTAFGSKEITDNLEKNLNADFARGWGIVPVSELPTMQDFNAVGFTISSLVTHLYQNGIAEYAEKQIYNKGAVCLSEGNIYISKTENNAGNPVTDTTQWQSLKDAILAANIVQQLGNATDKVMSQKSVTDALNTKQAKGDYATKKEMNNALSGKQPTGDYATKTELTQGLNTKLNSAAVKQTTGNSTTDVISQKACDDNYAKKDSWETFTAGEINIKSNGNYTSLTLIKGDGNKLLLETAPGDAYFVYRDTKNNNKAVVTIPSNKNGTLALTNNPTDITAPKLVVKSPSTHGYIELIAANGNTWRIGSNNNDQRAYLEKIGTDRYSIYFPTKGGTLALDSNIIGINQRWQNVTSSRDLNVTYKNNTNKPIAVSFNKNYKAEDGGTYAYVDDVLIVYSDTGRGYDSVTPSTRPVFFIVPSNSTYRINAASKNLWAELR